MKNRQNTPNLEKCVVLLMMALEFAERGGFEANRGIVDTPPLSFGHPPLTPLGYCVPQMASQFGGEQAKAVTG